jgi:type IV pilus assembly protein PilB
VTPADDYVIQFALERGLLRRDRIEAARRRAARQAATATGVADATGLARELVAEGALDERAVALALSAEFDLPFVEIGEARIAPEALAALPREFVTRHLVCPVGWQGGALQVATSDPLAVDVLDAVEHMAGRCVVPCIATGNDIHRAIERHYGPGRDTADDWLAEAVEQRSAAASLAEEEAGETSAPDAPVIKLVHDIITEAVRRRASDIHLEPLERRFRVRYRIDGVLVEAAAPPKRQQLAIISRLKIMANISIAEKRVPQDGRIQIELAGRPLDLRVASLPTAHGESIVMRLLDRQNLRLGLPELGFGSDDEKLFRRLLASPDGLILVTGPTGSGKTTTLYACLHHLNQPDRKIVTVEDPVEYQLGGINQVPVRPEIGMTFGAALRAMLRQSPNIIMVGEIRDRETAEIAINAALTGHLVFSTLHTNDAPGAVTRLLDLGVKPFLVAASLRAVMAQRLVRRICPQCRRPGEPSPHELRMLGLTAAQAAGASIARGAGCSACRGSGYLGRTGIFEIFFANDVMRELIAGSASAGRLRAQARQDGMRTMREDGLRKVLAGLTTIEEAVSATVADLE